MSVNPVSRRALLQVGALASAASSAYAQGGPIVVGQTVVASGPLKGLAVGPVQGIDAAVAALNKAGGIGGRRIELVRRDDASDGARAADNVREFAKQGAVAAIMPIGTVSAIGALKAAHESKLPLLGAYTGAAPARASSAYNFPLRIGFDEESRRLVNHLFIIGQSVIAMVHNDNPGAKGVADFTAREAEARGRKLAAVASVANDASNVDALVRQVAAARPQALILAATNLVAAAFIKAYRAVGGTGQFYSNSFLDGRTLAADIGDLAGGVVISQVVPSPWAPTLRLAADYRDAMKAVGHNDLSYPSMEGYLTVRVLGEALRRAGPVVSPESVRAALEGLGTLDIGGLRVQYAPGQHVGAGFSELSMLRKDGSYLR